MSRNASPPPELTALELNALENMARDREAYKRGDATWDGAYPETDLIESAMRKLRDRAWMRHQSILGHAKPVPKNG